MLLAPCVPYIERGYVMSNHPVVHIEFAANDPEAAGKFYADLFGWQVEIDRSVPGTEYVTFQAEPGPGGGFPKIDGEMYKAGDIIIYVATEDIEATAAKVKSLGGKVLVPKTEIPNTGWFAIVADPTGNRLGLFAGMGE